MCFLVLSGDGGKRNQLCKLFSSHLSSSGYLHYQFLTCSLTVAQFMCMRRSDVVGKTLFMKIFKCHLISYISLTPSQWTHGSSWWSSHQGVKIFQQPIEIKNTSCENAQYFNWECPSNANLYIIYFFAILF